MATFDLQRLGSLGFQDVVAALAIKEFGAQVNSMGRGKDGGRDMFVVKGRIAWSAGEDGKPVEVWSGTTVFQVKHKERLEGAGKDVVALWARVKTELDLWSHPDRGRDIAPDNLVIATNIPLTPAPGSGGFDTLNTKIRRYLDALDDDSAEDSLPEPAVRAARELRRARRDRMRRLVQWRVWDGNQITALLNAHGDVRRAFDGFLTAGDVLADLSILDPNLNQSQLPLALKKHARTALMAERRVHFDEAGGETKGVPVEDVVIDLPILSGGRQVSRGVISHVLDRGEQVLKPTLTLFEKPRHLVLTGAPGNGKSTVAKFLTHAYRAVFVSEEVDLGDDHKNTVARTKTALQRIGARVPAHRRWPVNIDLAKYALEQPGSDYTLVRWISTHLSQQVASKSIPAWELQRWLKRWPSFIVLDGLDEVTEPSVRQTLIANIEAFAADAESEDWDTLIIVTTRPTGYQDDMPSTTFQRIDLSDLTVDDAVHYGRLVTKVRVPDDQDRREGIIALLEAAAKDDGLKHLLRTPLQTLIMSIIAESSGQFSPSRFALFWGYYQTIEQREKNKKLGSLLRDHAQQVLDLHLRIGLLLQKQTETASGADAVLSPEELRNVAWQVLADAGYEPSGRDKGLLDRLLAAATHRLVLLVPQLGGGYGFDVRSLQELMAAYSLTTGKLEKTIPNLHRIGASPHWRNTLLFAAGRYFSEPQPHQKQAVMDLVLNLDDAPERLGSVFPVGPNVAMEIVDDGMVTEPKYLHPLLAHALKALDEPAGFEQISYARMLMSAAAKSQAALDLVAEGLRDALGSFTTSRSNAEAVQRAISGIGGAIDATQMVRGLAIVKRDPSKTLPDDPDVDWAKFSATLHENSENEALHSLFEAAQTADGLESDQRDILAGLLDDEYDAFVIGEALGDIKDGAPHLMAILRRDLLPSLWRRPVDLIE
ncbi:hypothetical protein IPV09_10955 [Tessaracoccus sp. SD287]|uniref:NACHT domain-containing protein n=1 Tax=Tessaracoccus sp. SD287 TaxID=2782008 RepID=UPI001A965EE1|nr:hypothetical protein [Tessaracoccus sp. SD287]MBO1031853.1 hypothetical protein [Tessaracoccus sp. SD287]